MQNLRFLRSLNEQSDGNNSAPPKLTDSIQYNEYDIELIDKRIKTVFVPERHGPVFEDYINNADMITEIFMREAMRKFNAVTEI